MKKRTVLAALTVTLSAAALSVVTSGTQAMAEPAATAGICYDGFTAINFEGAGVYPYDGSYYKTSGRCNDINLRVASGTMDACVIFISHTKYCNYWTTVGTGWTTIATNVKDGTHFLVGLQDPNDRLSVTAYVAF